MQPCNGIRCLVELAVAWLLLVGGILITPLPLPVGILMLVPGVALLARRSRFVRQRIRVLCKRYPGFSEHLKRLEPKVNEAIARTLRETDPER